jgi:hypothetical protein
MVVWQMKDELERIWEEEVMALSKYYPSICLEGLRKIMENGRLTGVPGEIQTEKFQNMNLKFCQYASAVR